MLLVKQVELVLVLMLKQTPLVFSEKQKKHPTHNLKETKENARCLATLFRYLFSFCLKLLFCDSNLPFLEKKRIKKFLQKPFLTATKVQNFCSHRFLQHGYDDINKTKKSTCLPTGGATCILIYLHLEFRSLKLQVSFFLAPGRFERLENNH